MTSHASLDTVLMIVALAAYAISALALLAFFFTRQPALQAFGAPLAALGCITQFAQLIARYEMTGIWPLLNLYGSLSLFAAFGVLIFIIFAIRYDLWFAGGFVIGIAALFLAYGTTWNEGTMPAVPSLQSYWIKIHIPLVVSSYASFLLAFVLSSIYIVKYYIGRSLEAGYAGIGNDLRTSVARTSKNYFDTSVALADAGLTPKIPDGAGAAEATLARNPTAVWLDALPSLSQLDILTYRVVAVGLPLLTLGIITGAMWAREAWGAYWQWDPKETAALFSWIIYAIYMHLHTRSAWKGVNSAWICVIGFASIIFCYLGVNIWISGLHSYKM